ncbi:MAG: hypothetical protein MJ187_04865 [Alphaproteobacteria bacterium]|nr:hypothetical protein [Alphaproteobacteria bacterium]
MKFFTCLIITTCITLCSNNVFGAESSTFSQCASGAVAGSKRCALVFSGQHPYRTDVSGGKTTTLWLDTPVCCKQWTKDTDTECECKSENRLSGGANAVTKTCNICGSTAVTLSYSPGTTGGGTTTGNGVDCTASNCSQARITDENGTIYCLVQTDLYNSCSGTSNAPGFDTCGLFSSKCYGGWGVTDSGGKADRGPKTCKSGYHKYRWTCIKDCSVGYYGTITDCQRCPEFNSPTDGTASGKYGTTTSTNASSINECIMSAGTTGSDGRGSYKISAKCSYQ